MLFKYGAKLELRSHRGRAHLQGHLTLPEIVCAKRHFTNSRKLFSQLGYYRGRTLWGVIVFMRGKQENTGRPQREARE